MNGILGLVATLLGVLLFIQVFTLIVVVSRLVKVQLWEARFQDVPRDDAALELPILDAARSELEAAGFEYVSTRCMRAHIASTATLPSYLDVYYHRGHDVHAEVSAAALPTPTRPFNVQLLNYYTDGKALLTTNGVAHQRFPYPSNVVTEDANVPTFAMQLDAHLARRSGIAGEPVALAAEPSSARQFAQELLPGMEREGKVYRRGELDGEVLYGLRFVTAVKMAVRMRLGMMRNGFAGPSSNGKVAPAPEVSLDVQQAVERVAFIRSLCTMHDLRAPRWFRWSAFMISAGAFIALGAWLWGWWAALLLAAVVVVHEAGHWLAMRLAHFRDIQVFFIPGMGGATSGEKHEASPLTHLAVYLAGPVPGLLFATAAFAWLVHGGSDPHAWWYHGVGVAAGAAFFINMLNLLPLMPLDGGRIVDLFILGRLPWFRFAFALASACLLAWTGIVDDSKLMLGLGMLVLISMPHQYRSAKLTRELMRQRVTAPLAADSFVEAAGRLYALLAQPAYRTWRPATKIGIGRMVLPRFFGRLPNAKETLFGLLMYVACIVVPIGALVAVGMPNPERLIRLAGMPAAPAEYDTRAARQEAIKASRAQRERILSEAHETRARIRVLKALMEDADKQGDPQDHLRLAKLLYVETEQLPAPSRERALAAYELAQAADEEDDYEAAARPLADAESILRARLVQQADTADSLLLAKVVDSRIGYTQEPNVQAALQEVTRLYMTDRKGAGDALPMVRIRLAWVMDFAGQSGPAEAQLLAAEDDLNYLPDAPVYVRDKIKLDHAWFLLAHEHPEAALTLARPFFGPLDIEREQRTSSQRDARLLAALVARQRGDWNEVKAQAEFIRTFRVHAPRRWFEKLFAKKPNAYDDPRAALLLIEAERALGRNDVAGELVVALREQYQSGRRRLVNCRFGRAEHSWRQGLEKVLGEIERKELHCSDPLPPSIATPG